MSESVELVNVTPAAEKIIKKLRKKYGPLIFHQSGGCCDGSSPMCFQKEDFFINETDVFLGEIVDCNFYMARDQFEYWKHTHLTVDIVEGRGSSFSLEIPLGLRFIVKSRLLSKSELDSLKEQMPEYY
ncbi:MAG: DUF779 domain-containing protein [Cytophagales bacterium]|nr:DUF779 domain-containing protein [Cytophagales bacterium]